MSKRAISFILAFLFALLVLTTLFMLWVALNDGGLNGNNIGGLVLGVL